MTKTIHVPRIAPTVTPRIQSLLPEEVQRQLQKIQLPDHIVAARQECAYQFLEQVFLPEVSLNSEMGCEWVVQKIKDFKTQFQAKHPSDFKDFSLIESMQIKLELLLMTDTIDRETSDIIKKGYSLLQRIIQDCGSNLSQI